MKTTSSLSLSLFAALGLLAAGGTGCNKPSVHDPAVDSDSVADVRKSESGGAAADAGADTGSGWGTLKGKFTYNGAVPTMTVFDIAKDKLCTIPVSEESLIVNGSNKGLKNVVIYAQNVKRVTPDYAAAASKDAHFDQKDCRYLSHVFASTLKDKFVILNTDNATHNSQGDPGSGNDPYNSLVAPLTGRFEPKLVKPTPLPYAVTCAIHPWMKAYHIVRNDPYVAVTNENGEFAIEKLPAGTELEFQVWHERGAGTNGRLKAKPDWSGTGRFKTKIAKDGETVTMEINVEQGALN